MAKKTSDAEDGWEDSDPKPVRRNPGPKPKKKARTKSSKNQKYVCYDPLSHFISSFDPKFMEIKCILFELHKSALGRKEDPVELWANRSRQLKIAQNGNFLIRAFGTANCCNLVTAVQYEDLPIRDRQT
ncbi:hypothetical protein DFH09DRAFT_1085386 [Mycena vulgaris]|nr:hypothetical protein DFH09DRAFT_1085386 [Mycena vulgaris]